MRRRGPTALFALSGAALAAAAAMFALADSNHSERSRPAAGPDAPELGAVAVGRVVARLRAAERREEIAKAREAAPQRAHERHTRPRPRDVRRLERLAAAAEPVARRFFAAFSRYELGELDAAVRSELRVTATAQLAGELLAAPTRRPPGAVAPDRARLGRLRFVAGDSDAARRVLLTAELVGDVLRGGERSPIALEMENVRGGWRVGGLGR